MGVRAGRKNRGAGARSYVLSFDRTTQNERLSCLLLLSLDHSLSEM